MTRLLCIVVLVACSGKPSAPAHPVHTSGPNDPAHRSGGTEAKPTADSETAAAGSDRSEAQCDKLIAHAIELGTAERPADQKPTDDERAAMHSQLRTSWSPKCKQLTSRGYECALAAHTLAELDRCGA